ncbi:aminotransferase class IV [Oscillatoria salina]|uniref:aminotransferase class IV n=1 Tax=Oscillatoria salina TaxID=331517 RepID=UPI0013B7AC5C|nr:aminotransferase class IV [Oscillatoria salina]MBZ8180975.1 branched-chain amino acid aminotransferase [Oscillatoria salina IIICB1]NET89651.1 branched-chain amino acid aminotransferase [Kamptonema sp. SIO1D9]
MTVCINGKFLNSNEATISIFDHGFLYGDGVFDTIAAVNEKIWWLDEHLDRLIEGCSSISLKHPWSKSELIELTKETFHRTEGRNGRIRITITRGVGEVPSYSIETCKPNLVIFVTPLDFPEESKYSKGLSLKSVNYSRVFPKVKNLNFLPSIIGYTDAKKAGFDDSVFVNFDGYVTEGTTWNIFLFADRKLIAPGDSILVGVTRNKVIELSESLGIDIEVRPVSLQELYSAQEVFATGTTKRILGVTKIDDFVIGKGSVGELTRKLLEEFRRVYY